MDGLTFMNIQAVLNKSVQGERGHDIRGKIEGEKTKSGFWHKHIICMYDY